MLSFILMFSTNSFKNAKPPRWWARFGPWDVVCRPVPNTQVAYIFPVH